MTDYEVIALGSALSGLVYLQWRANIILEKILDKLNEDKTDDDFD